MPRGNKLPDLTYRHPVHLLAGPPVDLTDLRGGVNEPVVLHQVTERIMDRITALVEQLRGEPAPATRFDPGPAPPHHLIDTAGTAVVRVERPLVRSACIGSGSIGRHIQASMISAKRESARRSSREGPRPRTRTRHEKRRAHHRRRGHS